LAGKVTVFFSTHILADVERICDRIIIINEGKKLLEDSIENIKQVPDVRELEIELESEKDTEFFLEIKNTTVVEEVKIEKNRVNITTSDIDELRTLVYKVLDSKKIMIKKMFVKEVSLEDIFIKAVNHNA
jgi:ABC-2 type transport system ATP-binding protein